MELDVTYFEGIRAQSNIVVMTVMKQKIFVRNNNKKQYRCNASKKNNNRKSNWQKNNFFSLLVWWYSLLIASVISRGKTNLIKEDGEAGAFPYRRSITANTFHDWQSLRLQISMLVSRRLRAFIFFSGCIDWRKFEEIKLFLSEPPSIISISNASGTILQALWFHKRYYEEISTPNLQ